MKKKLLSILFGSALVFSLAACGGNDEAGDDTATDDNTSGEESTADAGDAQKLYDNNCMSCHGGDLSGGAGPALDKIGANYSADEIHDIIINGKGAMPGGLLNEEEANTVAEWLAAKK
ncbi:MULTISPECIES: cytochrome c551 [Cytobacillus]|uniref:cytochrome c551 n=1 Tax=Cytobacillus TaxID=2675230 RepID=UPI001CD2B6E1|nr:cytochrome c [Cytobacillus kochii]MCA1026784.1 cytochrome c [Cytobacillus kochii]MCM3322792.1 cytochrome c [Cytobacillus kochii]MCM3344729.1 cytochrome c [Cytobacillus kochii]MDM5209271.1 cytochrome c [Cytobacillus kochii]